MVKLVKKKSNIKSISARRPDAEVKRRSEISEPRQVEYRALFDDSWKSIVAEGARELGVELSASQLDKFAWHAEELIKWNDRFNITSITAPSDVALKHFIDSIAAAPYIPFNSKVIDLGSGGGFPGIPLKITDPSLDVVMVDSSRKKVGFINELIRNSGFSGLSALHIRAEQLGRDPEYSHQFDFVISRAFTALNDFIDMALPFLKKGGTIIAMKGALKPDELTPVSGRNDLEVDISEYYLPFEHHRRSLVFIRELKQ